MADTIMHNMLKMLIKTPYSHKYDIMLIITYAGAKSTIFDMNYIC